MRFFRWKVEGYDLISVGIVLYMGLLNMLRRVKNTWNRVRKAMIRVQ